MSKPGRKPKPRHLKVIEGNRGKRPLARNEPKPRPVRPTRPEWLLPEAKREWARIVPELETLGLLTVVDRAALAAYCQAYARAVEAEKTVSKEGATYPTDTGQIKARPEMAIALKEWQLMRALAAEFGLTPSSRSRIELKPLEEDEPWWEEG